MKHTVKSLLITTVLTLPTAFGAESLPASDPLTDASTQGPSSSTCVAADTKDSRPQSTLDTIPPKLLQKMTGWSKFTLGFLDAHDLAGLALPSNIWNKFMLRGIKNWGQTEILRLLENKPLDLPTTDKQALAFLRINADFPANTPDNVKLFITILNIAVAMKLWEASKPSNERVALDTAIDNNRIISVRQKSILKLLLPNEGPFSLIRAADGLKDLGADYRPKAAELYEKAANHKGATPCDIRSAANGLKALGDDYRPTVAEIYINLGNRKNVSPIHILNAADGLKALGDDYHEKAAALYVESANHPEASPWDIRSAADRLKALGLKYYPSTERLYAKLAAHDPNDRGFYMLWAADGLSGLGDDYHDKAAELYAKLIDHQSVHSWAHGTAIGFKALGPKYVSKAAELYINLGSQQKATPWDILTAADGLMWLGDDYYENAADLYENAAIHLKAVYADILKAANGVKALGPKYYDRAAELYEKAATHAKATPADIHSAANGVKALGPNYHDRTAKLYEVLAHYPESFLGDIQKAAKELKALGSTYPANSDERIKYNEMADELLQKRGLSM